MDPHIFNQTRTTFLNKTSSNYYQNNNSNWTQKDFYETKKRHNQTDFLLKKLTFLETRFQEEERQIKKRYQSLQEIQEKIVSKIQQNIKETENQIETKIEKLCKEEEKNLQVLESETQNRKVQEQKLTHFIDDKFLALKSDV